MVRNPNPFGDFDINKMMDMTKMMDMSKIMADFKMPNFSMPNFNMDVLVKAQRKNFEALTAANQLAIEGYQAVAKRQADILRESMEEMSKVSRDLVAADQAPDVRVAKQVELAKTGFEKALANARELGEMLMKSNTEACDVINKRITEALDEVKHSVGNGKLNGKGR